jgi:hypothetical protein
MRIPQASARLSCSAIITKIDESGLTVTPVSPSNVGGIGESAGEAIHRQAWPAELILITGSLSTGLLSRPRRDIN